MLGLGLGWRKDPHVSLGDVIHRVLVDGADRGLVEEAPNVVGSEDTRIDDRIAAGGIERFRQLAASSTL